MSLIIHTIVCNGIVVASDTRTTSKDDKGNTRYNDTAYKTIAFPNNIVISHCGDANITPTETVHNFLITLRKKLKKQNNLFDIPLLLLNEYLKCCCGNPRKTTFLISGYAPSSSLMGAMTYKITPADRQIVLCRTPFNYGSNYFGTSEIAHSFMNGASYENMSLDEAIDLTKACLNYAITAYKYRPEQIVGGEARVYVIDRLNNKAGWLNENNDIVPDSDI